MAVLLITRHWCTNLADVDVTFHDAGKIRVVDSLASLPDKKRLKTFHRGGDIWRQQFVMCSTIPWNMVVPPESTKLALKRRETGKDASNERNPTSVSSCSLPLCRWRKHLPHHGTGCLQNDSSSVDTSRECVSRQDTLLAVSKKINTSLIWMDRAHKSLRMST